MTWVIEWMQCIPTEGQYTNVVINAGWRCNGNQVSNGVEFTGTIYGSVSFPQPASGGQFTPYASLTQDQVLGWIWANGVNKSSAETSVQHQIDNKINPPMVEPPLPWA